MLVTMMYRSQSGHVAERVVACKVDRAEVSLRETKFIYAFCRFVSLSCEKYRQKLTKRRT